MSRWRPRDGLGELAAAEPFDVCVVGAGIAGTVLGTALVRAGVRTAIIESGRDLLAWLVDPRVRALAAYTTSGDAEYPTQRTHARAIGGTSNFWTGRCERFHPSDFERHPYTPVANPWPVDYTGLEPYYERAESTLRVRGGPPSRYAPPRRRPFPLRARTTNTSLKQLLADVDVTIDDSPTATPARGLRFFRVQKEVLPHFLGVPHALLVSGLTVTRLVMDAERRITAVEARTLDGVPTSVRARLFVVACGGIESPRLLLLSSSPTAPRGIGNHHDLVGRYFNEHPGVNYYARIAPRSGTRAPGHRIGRSHQFYGEPRRDGLGAIFPVFIQSWIFPNHLMRLRLADLPRGALRIAARAISPALYVGATVEMRPDADCRVTLSRSAVDRFGNPLAHLHVALSEDDRQTLDRARQRILGILRRLGAQAIEEGELTWSRHHIGTCRMGRNPTTSVTDPELRVHDTSNLYVCGSEVFVTGSALPPVLTLTALAYRLADHLVTRLRQDTGARVPARRSVPDPAVAGAARDTVEPSR